MKKKFVTIFPETTDATLLKDVGMIPYLIGQYDEYDSTVVTCRNGEYTNHMKYLRGLKLEFLNNRKSQCYAGMEYLWRNGKTIDVLNIYHLDLKKLPWILIYKIKNRSGKIFYKLDADIRMYRASYSDRIIKKSLKKYMLKTSSIVTCESREMVKKLSELYNTHIEYLPNGFYHFYKFEEVVASQKRNVFFTVGRIGAKEKNIKSF